MARWPKAIWQPVNNYSGTLRPIAVCLHHQAGSGNPFSVYQSRGVSAHFWLPKSGQPYQHVDTGNQAWHGVQHNAYSIGVETEGCGSPPHAEPLTENQLNLFAELMQWANQIHGIPLTLSESVTTPGFNYHRCQGGPSTGCPCDERKNSRTEILRRAGFPFVQPQPEEDNNMILLDSRSGGYWVAFRDGAVHAYKGAPYLGGTNNDKYNRQKWPCVGIAARRDGNGYTLGLDPGNREINFYEFPYDGSAKP